MNNLSREMFGFGKARRATLAFALMLGLAALWPAAATANTMLPAPAIKTLTDDGEGKIRAKWELSFDSAVGFPEKVCAESSRLLEHGGYANQAGSDTETCFDSTQWEDEEELVFPSGIDRYPGVEESGFEVILIAYFTNQNAVRVSQSKNVIVKAP